MCINAMKEEKREKFEHQRVNELPKRESDFGKEKEAETTFFTKKG